MESQQILKEWTKPTFERLSITEVTKTRPNALVLCLPPTHWRNKRKHPLQFLCQTREKKLNPLDRWVCIHNDWWTEVIWNKDKECYYTNGILKRLHNYDETNSEKSEEKQHKEGKGPTVDQQIRQTPIDPALCSSPIISTISLPSNILTAMTATATKTTTMSTATMSRFRPAPMAQQRIATTMQKALLHKGKGSGLPGGRGSGLPGGGGSGLPGGRGPRQPRGGGQPAAAQQPVQVAADIKAMGSLPQIFNGDRSKADDFIEEVKGYFHLNANVMGYDSLYKKVAFTLMLIKVDELPQWVQNMGN